MPKSPVTRLNRLWSFWTQWRGQKLQRRKLQLQHSSVIRGSCTDDFFKTARCCVARVRALSSRRHDGTRSVMSHCVRDPERILATSRTWALAHVCPTTMTHVWVPLVLHWSIILITRLTQMVQDQYSAARSQQSKLTKHWQLRSATKHEVPIDRSQHACKVKESGHWPPVLLTGESHTS